MRQAIGRSGCWWPGGSTAWGGGRSRPWQSRRAGWIGVTSRCSLGSSRGPSGVWTPWGRWCSGWRCAGSGRPAAVHPGRRHAGAQDGPRGRAGGPERSRRMHHDPRLSTARKPFCSFGHVWVVLALWVPLPLGGTRGCALPLLVRLYVGAKRGGTQDAPGRPRRGTRQHAAEPAHAAHPRPTKLALARDLLALVAGWAEGRTVSAVVASAYAARATPGKPPGHRPRAQPPAPGCGPLGTAGASSARPAGTAAPAWPPPAHPEGDGGHPSSLGSAPAHPLRPVTPRVFGGTARWYGALRDQPVRILLVRDPRGRRRDEAGFCTDLTVDHDFILTGYARRWTIAVRVSRSKAGPRLRRPPEPAARGCRPYRPQGRPRLRSGPALVRRTPPAGARHRLARPPLVPFQDHTVLPRYAHGRPSGVLAPLLF